MIICAALDRTIHEIAAISFSAIAPVSTARAINRCAAIYAAAVEAGFTSAKGTACLARISAIFDSTAGLAEFAAAEGTAVVAGWAASVCVGAGRVASIDTGCAFAHLGIDRCSSTEWCAAEYG